MSTVEERKHKAAWMKLWRKNNPEKDKAIRKRWYEKHREEIRQRSADTQRRIGLKYRYGITEKEYEEQFQLQKGVCAVCRRPAPSGKPLFIDHNPTNGENRGLLCFSCNVSLGHFGDSVEMLLRAIEYLKNPPWKVKVTR